MSEVVLNSAVLDSIFPFEVNDHLFNRLRETNTGVMVRCDRCGATLFFPTNQEIFQRLGVTDVKSWMESTLGRFPSCVGKFVQPSNELKVERESRSCCGGRRDG